RIEARTAARCRTWRGRDDVSGVRLAQSQSTPMIRMAEAMRRVLLGCVLVAAAGSEFGVGHAESALEVLPVQGTVFVLVGPNGNTTVQIGPEGPLVVDTQPA